MKRIIFMLFISLGLNSQNLVEKIAFQSANPFSFHDVITDLENQEKEIERANIALDETKIRIEQIKNDIEREKFLFEDAKQSFRHYNKEKADVLVKINDRLLKKYK